MKTKSKKCYACKGRGFHEDTYISPKGKKVYIQTKYLICNGKGKIGE